MTDVELRTILALESIAKSLAVLAGRKDEDGNR
jgi:hypothetical protein